MAYGQDGKTYAAIYVLRDGKWVTLAEAIGNGATPVTPVTPAP